MRRRVIAFSTAGLAFLASAGTAAAHPAKAPLCPGGRFVVEQQPLVAGDAAVPETIAIVGARIAIGSACPPVPALLKDGHVTMLRALWPADSCRGLKGRVWLRATIVQDCSLMKGMLTAERRHRQFRAFLSTCGDGVVDPGNGEQCDGRTGCSSGETCVRCACVPVRGGTTTSTTVTTTSTTAPACGSAGAACASGAACCSTLCEGGTCTCVPPQQPCGSDAECCAGGTCSAGNCCLPAASPCQDSTDCCSECCSLDTGLCIAFDATLCM